MVQRATTSVLLAFLLVLSSVLAPPARAGQGQIAQGATMTVLKGEVALVHLDGTAEQPALGESVRQSSVVRRDTE